MSQFNRDLYSLTSAMSPTMSFALTGGKSAKSKKTSKKTSKKGSRKQSGGRGMPQFMVDMMAVKKEVKSKHTDIKDGPALSKVVSEQLKSKGSVDKAVEALNNMSSSELKSKLDTVNREIAEKRASKKQSRQSSKKSSKKSKQSRGMPQFMVDMMAVKKEVKANHTDIKDGPALSKVVSEQLKSQGSVDKAIKALNDMSSSDLKSKLEKVNREIAEKRASKKQA